MPYGQNVDDDEEARKKAAKNPLTEYFGGQGSPPPPPPPAPVPAATNTGGMANTGAQQRAPAPTGFTNFSRFQGANRDVSNREAAAYGQRATDNANRAKQSLGALQARFGGEVNAGTVGGPQMEYAARGRYDVTPQFGQLGGNRTAEEMYANAGKSYSGPMGLGQVEGAGDSAASALAAEQNLGALGDDAGIQALIRAQNSQGNAGTSKFSANLVGSAGRKGFDALRARFNPQDDLEKADTEAIASAKAAGESSAKNAADWGKAGDARKASNEAAAGVTAKRSADAETDTKAKKKDAELDAAFEKAMEHDVDDQMNSNFESFNNVMNPITQIASATGNRDPIQDWGTNTLTPTSGGQSGGGSRKIWWQPEHKDVFKQMDDAQWAELRKLTQANQARWLDTRADEVARGAPHEPFDATKDIYKNAFYGWKL